MARKVRTGCRDCRKCTNSMAANFGRNTGRGFMAYTTVGMSEVALASRKKCRICGHQLSLHMGSGATTVQPVVEVRTHPAGAVPGGASISASGVTDEIARLADLHRAGHLTDDEFATLKGRVIAAGEPAKGSESTAEIQAMKRVTEEPGLRPQAAARVFGEPVWRKGKWGALRCIEHNKVICNPCTRRCPQPRGQTHAAIPPGGTWPLAP